MGTEIVVDVAEARANLAELTNKVFFERNRFVLRRRGVPIAVLLGIDDYRDLLRADSEATNRLRNERRRLAAEMDALRKRIGPVSLRVADLINEARRANEEGYAGTSDH